MARLTDKVAFITGSARGQGRAEAVRLATEGADIIAVDIAGPVTDYNSYAPASRDDLDETVALVTEPGRKVVAERVDVRDLDALQFAVDEGVAAMGRLDIVVANAGDIADMVAFLTSDECRYITGAQLPMDMGTLTR